MKKIVFGAFLIALAGSTTAFAQGAATGAATGAVGGAIVGGPAGAAVGATVGAVAGGIADESRPRFRTYVGGHAIPLIDTTVRSGSALICHPAA
jgi:hypothetical protein